MLLIMRVPGPRQHEERRTPFPLPKGGENMSSILLFSLDFFRNCWAIACGCQYWSGMLYSPLSVLSQLTDYSFKEIRLTYTKPDMIETGKFWCMNTPVKPPPPTTIKVMTISITPHFPCHPCNLSPVPPNISLPQEPPVCLLPLDWCPLFRILYICNRVAYDMYS